ncbi:MAG TPA: hypothetical protein VFS50_18195 [Meiothermus sp.]|jgi:antitoxin (DNA-binding transcriptional repressor) of toxin-antitoxin stability system|nr:hypothetical protein [Meiothermus sp.]
MSLPKIRQVGVREFREELAAFLNNPEPVAVTRHGRTIGYFIPAPDPERAKADLQTFLKSASRVEALLSELGVTEEEILDEFKQRRGKTSPKTPRDRRDGAD